MGALEQSAPDSFERELTNMLTYNTPLRERVCALHLQLEALVAANNPIPANTIAEAVGIYSDILSGLTPSNQQWLRTMWQVVEIEQYEGVSAETAWQTVNDTLLPTSVQTSHAESSGGQIVKIYILAALFVASTATFILQFTRRSA